MSPFKKKGMEQAIRDLQTLALHVRRLQSGEEVWAIPAHERKERSRLTDFLLSTFPALVCCSWIDPALPFEPASTLWKCGECKKCSPSELWGWKTDDCPNSDLYGYCPHCREWATRFPDWDDQDGKCLGATRYRGRNSLLLGRDRPTLRRHILIVKKQRVNFISWLVWPPPPVKHKKTASSRRKKSRSAPLQLLDQILPSAVTDLVREYVTLLRPYNSMSVADTRDVLLIDEHVETNSSKTRCQVGLFLALHGVEWKAEAKAGTTIVRVWIMPTYELVLAGNKPLVAHNIKNKHF